MKTGIIVVIVIAVIALIGGAIGYQFNQLNQPVEQNQGSVANASEYHHVTRLATTSSWYLYDTGPGALGSVVINVLGTGNEVFYDATTTNVNLRAGAATSTLKVLGVIGASQAAGTYTYDTVFFDGLLGVTNGAQGTSTLTFKP